MMRLTARPGYVFLVAVLTIGAIVGATSVSLFLLGWAQEQNGYVLLQTTRAYQYAQSCADIALLHLHDDPSYAGDEEVSLPFGTCTIASVGGSGTTDRSICVYGESGDTIRRIQIVVAELYPTISIDSWQDVATFTQCP